MKIYRFDPEIARPIEQFGSLGVSMGRGVRFRGDVQLGCFHVEPGGLIGYHEATRPQLFMCVEGENVDPSQFMPELAGRSTS